MSPEQVASVVHDELRARLAHELRRYRSPLEDAVHRDVVIESGLARIVAMLELLPRGTPDSRLLELGSSPFISSQALEVVWPGHVTHADYFGTAERRASTTLMEIGGVRTKTYESDLFNIETEEFPYPDGTFDVVTFAELLEHLAINPVWAL